METRLEMAAQELRELLTEAEFTSRWTLIVAYHSTGKIIKDLYDNQIGDAKDTKETIVQALAGKVGKKERMLWYAVKFFEMYPDLNALPEGKNVSFNQIITKYLTAPTDPKEEGIGGGAVQGQELPTIRTHECGKAIFEFHPDQMCHCQGGSGIIDKSIID